MKWLLVIVALFACKRDEPQLAVGAAAVLRHAMPELVEMYRATSGVRITVTYGASDKLVARGNALDGVLVAEDAALDGKRVVATTTLVLVGTKSGPTFATLASLPDGAKIAIGDPETVPAGRYAREYLKKLGLWDRISPRLVYGGDVAGVLAHAQRGTAHVAIVYRTDLERAGVEILDAPADAPAVTIVAGLATSSRNVARMRAFIDFLATAEAQAILARHGFGVPR